LNLLIEDSIVSDDTNEQTSLCGLLLMLRGGGTTGALHHQKSPETTTNDGSNSLARTENNGNVAMNISRESAGAGEADIG
jgi:hypothetical protein